MASRAFWTADELALLETHIHDTHWIDKVQPHLNRGEQALRCRMAKLRAERGMSDRRCSWMRDAVAASSRLAGAILGRPAVQPTLRIWCRQCDCMVDDVQADACASRWCKAKDAVA